MSTENLVVVAGHVLVPAAERDQEVERMQDLVRRADPADPRRVTNAEIWRERSAVASWRPHAYAPEQPDFEEVGVGYYEARVIDPL